MSKVILVLLVLAVFATVCFAQADRYPAGVSPASCPNYPFCNNVGHNVPIGYRFDSTNHRYPPGVDASTCPFFPYC